MEQKMERAKVEVKIRELFNTRESGGNYKEIPIEYQVVDGYVGEIKGLTDLSKYTNTIPVNSPSGKWVVGNLVDSVLTAPGEASTPIEDSSPLEVEYCVQTYRGKTKLSSELVEDEPQAVSFTLAKDSKRVITNTRNKAIAELLKEFDSTTVTSIDELKKVINIDLGSKFNTKIFVSDSAFHALDTLKTESGDYFDLKTLKEIVVLPDTVIGEAAGDKVGFIGDLYESVALFVKNEVKWKWVNNAIYGQSVLIATRFDAKIANENAGHYVIFDFE